jgi:putative flippase GtrA
LSESTLVSRLAGRRGVRQFFKFGVVGASGFVVNLVIFTVLQRVVPDHAAAGPYVAIYSTAFLSGGISNFFLNRAWTFRSTGHVGREGVSFMAVSVLALLVALLVSKIVSPWLGLGHKTWFVSTVAAIVVNFFINKYWTFRSTA